MGDSGGFEAATQGVRPNPELILKWLETNTDLAMNLDIPTTRKTRVLATQQELDESLSESVKNYEYFEKHRTNYNMILYNVLHGETYDYMDKWYNAVKDFNFESWAMGLVPADDMYIQVLGFSYLLEKGALDNAKGLHIFGKSGIQIMPILAYIARNHLTTKFVSFDSSSYNWGSIYRTYYMPNTPPGRKKLFFGNIHKDKNPEILSLPCFCNICQKSTVEDMNMGDYQGCLISLHNLWAMIQYNELVNSTIKDVESFSENTRELFDFVDFCVKNGTKAGFEHKKKEFKLKQGHKNIMSFHTGSLEKVMDETKKIDEKFNIEF
jgi:tRNA-guanine family transglycosylase